MADVEIAAVRTCRRCGKRSPKFEFEYGVRIVRYGYSGGTVDLCTDCFNKFKSWLDGVEQDKELN